MENKQEATAGEELFVVWDSRKMQARNNSTIARFPPKRGHIKRQIFAESMAASKLMSVLASFKAFKRRSSNSEQIIYYYAIAASYSEKANSVAYRFELLQVVRV
jgi:hypothetical protein